MRRTATTLGLLLLAICTPTATAATPEYFPFPAGYTISNFGVAADEQGNIWFGAASPNHTNPTTMNSQPTPSLLRLVPSQATPGTSNGLTFFPTPDPPNVNCCANQLRSLAYNKTDHKLYYVRSDGNVGRGDPATFNPGTSDGMTSSMLPGYQDLWDVAAAKGEGAWFTEHSSSNVAPTYYGGRIAFFNGGAPAEGPNVAIQNGNTSLNSLRYDSKPAGVAVDKDGKPWFVEEDPGNPGYRIASYSGSGSNYQEFQVAPCEGTAPCSGSYTGTGLTDLAIAPDGGIWFTNVINHKFGRFDGSQMVQYTMASIGLPQGDPRQITAAPDGTIWMTSYQSSGGTSSALVQIVPGADPTKPPTATVYKTPGTTPLGLAADDAGNLWFGTTGAPGSHKVGRLAGVIGAAPGGSAPAPTSTPTPTPVTPAVPAAPAPIVLKPLTIGTAKVQPPQVGNGAINTNQICVGPPEARCSLVYLIKEHEYVTGFPSAVSSAKKKKKPKPRVLGTKTVTLRGGQSAKVTVTLNKLGQRILKGKRKVKVDYTVTQKLANGKTKVLSRKTLTMKAGKKKAKAKKSAAVARAAAVKRGYYIEVKSQTYIQTNKAATSIKSFQFPCLIDGTQSGGNLLNKPLKISKSGAFSFSGKSTLRSSSNSVISVKVTGKYKDNKIKGRIAYLTDGVSCADRNYTAKYYGVNPQG
jgi:streptogramin lyase